MKKKLLVAAALALSYGTALAGMYHSGSTNVCADCHTMHASMAHDFNGATPVSTAPKSFADGSWLPNPGAPEARLLKGTETGVCVACHDAQTWAPDVVGDVNSTGTAYVRSAGFIPALAGDDAAQAKGHTMGWSGGLAPGGEGAQATFSSFTCVSCHSPHGADAAFRNLNPWGLYAGGTGYPTYYLSATPNHASGNDVRIAIDASTYATGNFDYYANAKVFYENGAANRLDDYCGKCHGKFHNDGVGVNQVGSAGTHFIRHPTDNQIDSPTADNTFTTKVYSTAAAAANYVGCLSCHKAHGTDNPFNLFYSTAANPAGGNALDDTESGDGGEYGGLCSNCHAQAR